MMLVIYGPTATGKTDLAIKLAKKYQGELISADSRQVYKQLDIATGKVSFTSKVERHEGYWIVDGVKIHGFDLVEPPGCEPGSKYETFSAADFVKFADTALIRISAANKLPIVVGGTGFYIKVLLDGLESIGIAPDLKLRSQLEKLLALTLFRKLIKINPSRANSMNESDRANPRRLIRAVEIAIHDTKQETKNILSSRQTIEPSNYLFIGLTAPNDFLYLKANSWVMTRLENGMIEEVRNLIENNINTNWLEQLGLEYRWITRYLTGKIEKSTAVDRLKGDIHSFIRRQKTYFKQFEKNKIEIFDISQKNWQIKLEKRLRESSKLIYTAKNG